METRHLKKCSDQLCYLGLESVFDTFGDEITEGIEIFCGNADHDFRMARGQDDMAFFRYRLDSADVIEPDIDA